MSSRSEVCSRCTLLSGLSAVREFAFCVLFPPRRTRTDRLPTPHDGAHLPVSLSTARSTGSRGAFDPRHRPIVRRFVTLEIKRANQAVAEHARAEGEGRARSGLHAE